VLAQGNDIVPIPGTTRRKHLDENIDALRISLTLSELDKLREAMPKEAVSGKRYPEAGMKMVNL
jgi:aryl-alcohol dehydrogenase-like predicted oxidoreductase